MVEDKTSIYISHRMSSCRFCDEIIVFDEGTIKERGNHEQLLSDNKLYSELWNAQAQYYISNKKSEFIKAYTMVQEGVENGTINSETPEKDLGRFTEKNNISMSYPHLNLHMMKE